MKNKLFLSIPAFMLCCLLSSVSCSNEGNNGDNSFPKKGKLVFHTGFEETSSIIPATSESPLTTPGYETESIIGKDNTLKEKSDWVKDLGGKEGGTFRIEYTGGNNTQRYARIMPEPGNPTNNVLAFWLDDSWAASENQVKGRVQGSLYSIQKPYKEFYQSIRVFLHKDWAALTAYPDKIEWLTIAEFWNNKSWQKGEEYGFRITLGIGKPNAAPSELNFILNAENAGRREIWKNNNINVKVPIGKWFTMDYYYKEGDQNTGRFYMEITPDGEATQLVYDITNFTHSTFDSAPNGLSGYNPMKLYTSKEIIAFMKAHHKPLQIYWDDWKLWRNK